MQIMGRILIIWSLVVVLAICLILAISGLSTNIAKPKPREFSIFFAEPGQPPAPDNKIMKLIQEELGVTLKYEFLVGDLEQKLGVMFAGGDFSDVVTGHTRFMNAGVLIPLEDLIEKHAPNLYEHYKPYWEMCKNPDDGHIYYLPNYGRYYGEYRATDFWGPCFWLQKAVLEEFGYPKVKTLDQYFDLIRRYKDKYPEIKGMPTIGFEILSFGWRSFCLRNPPQHLIGHPNDGGVVVDQGSFQAEVFADKDYAKRYYKKLNEMNALGLIDRESFTLNYDQYMVKLSSGRVLGMFDQKWNFNSANKSLLMQNLVERTFAPCPITYDESIRDWYMDRTVLNINNGLGITKNCKDPVGFLEFLDALVTEKWQKILGWGIKGEDYHVDENGVFYRTPEQRRQSLDLAWRLANTADKLWNFAPKMEGTYKDGNACSPSYQPEEFFETLRPYEQNFLNKYGYKTWADFYSAPPPNPPYYPAWQINLIEGSPAKVSEQRINDLSMKYLPRAIMSKPEEFENIWAEFVEEMRNLDYQAYEDRINAQIQWRLENWGGKQ